MADQTTRTDTASTATTAAVTRAGIARDTGGHGDKGSPPPPTTDKPSPGDTDASGSNPEGSDKNSWGIRNRLPGKVFSKKFSSTSRFVVSSKVWMHTIPTRDCDILMTFPSKTEDHVLLWLLARLRTRTPDLSVHVRHHSNTGVYGFYLTAPFQHLLKGAEESSMKKTVKSAFGGGRKEFIYDDQMYFEGSDDPSTFFTSQERQSIVLHMLNNLRAVDTDVLDHLKFVEGQAIVPRLVSKDIIKHVLPLHNNDNLEELRKGWMQAFFKYQPLDKICDYFGVKIAMYFAYLGHYTGALTLPAFLGLILWFVGDISQYSSDLCFVIFAFFNVIWATLYLEHWKRRSAEFAYQWGTLDNEDELLQEPRPLFHGTHMKSPVTGRMEPDYPAWKRNLFRYFVSLPIILLSLMVIFATMWGIFEIQGWTNDKVKCGDFPSFFKFLPKILLALSIGILDDIYKKIAYWLNDQENYRLDEDYENHLIIKLVLFQSVNSFLSLFYIAFYLQDMDRLKDQLAALLITRQVVGNIKEALVPFVIEKIKLFRISYQMAESMSADTMKKHLDSMEKDNGTPTAEASPKSNGDVAAESEGGKGSGEGGAEEGKGDDDVFGGVTKEVREGLEGEMEVTHSGATLTQAEVEASMKTYEDTFEDYLEMFIQFGYVTLFSSAFPMAAMCALLNNVIEIRSDAFKLCMTFQRPFGQRVQSIGTWQDVLEIMSVIAVMVNCALIGMSDMADRLFPGWGTIERIIFIVILEHLVLALKLTIAYAIPDIPHWVAEEKARLEFMRRGALKKLETRTPPPPTTPGIPSTSIPQPKGVNKPSTGSGQTHPKSAVSPTSTGPSSTHSTRSSMGANPRSSQPISRTGLSTSSLSLSSSGIAPFTSSSHSSGQGPGSTRADRLQFIKASTARPYPGSQLSGSRQKSASAQRLSDTTIITRSYKETKID